jgi:hypothetical protein
MASCDQLTIGGYPAYVKDSLIHRSADIQKAIKIMSSLSIYSKTNMTVGKDTIMHICYFRRGTAYCLCEPSGTQQIFTHNEDTLFDVVDELKRNFVEGWFYQGSYKGDDSAVTFTYENKIYVPFDTATLRYPLRKSDLVFSH